jgi:hypothetical protein
VRAPQIELKNEGVFVGAAVEQPLQRCVGDEAAVPVEFSRDFRSWKAGRQRAAGHHMMRANLVGGVIEVDEVAVADVHSADTEASYSGIYQVKVHQAFERGFEWGSIVVAHFCGVQGRIKVALWCERSNAAGQCLRAHFDVIVNKWHICWTAAHFHLSVHRLSALNLRLIGIHTNAMCRFRYSTTPGTPFLSLLSARSLLYGANKAVRPGKPTRSL